MIAETIPWCKVNRNEILTKLLRLPIPPSSPFVLQVGGAGLEPARLDYDSPRSQGYDLLYSFLGFTYD